ncbi:MAG: ABC transporter substrate-binding protein, partial [Nitrospiraceae bacterium]
LRAFEAQHPGLKVLEELLPASTDQQHQFYVMNLEGQSVAFDLLAVDIIWVQEFARAGWIEALDDLLAPRERDEYFPAALQAATFEGGLYAMPWYLDAGVLYYRRDLLERYGFVPPRTWPDLVRMTRAIMDGERDPKLKGFLWQGKQYEGLVCVALEFIRSNGSDLFADRGSRAEAALRFMRGLIVPEGITPLLVATADEEATRHLFGSGRAIFMRNWPYAWSLLQEEGSRVRGKIGLAPLPSFPGHRSVSTLGGWMLAIPKRAAHPREAQALIRFLTSGEIQREMALRIGYNPSRRSLYQDPVLLETRPWMAMLDPVLAEAKPRPISPYYLMLSQLWQPELSAALVGTKSARAALASAHRQMERILALERPEPTGSR